MKKCLVLLLVLIICVSLSVPALAGTESSNVGETRTVDNFGYIDTDGGLWLWGRNYFGQAGQDPSIRWVDRPTKVMDGVVSFGRAVESTIVLKLDGSVWTFGHDYRGLRNEGLPGFATEYQYGHEPMYWMDDCVAVSIGNDRQFAAVKSDGSLWTWGNDIWRCLGYWQGDIPDANPYELGVIVPQKILDGVKSVAMGRYNGYAIREDDSLWYWGGDEWFDGNLGQEYATPPVKILDNVRQISANDWAGVVFKDGSYWGWGGGLTPVGYNMFSARKYYTNNVAMVAGLYYDPELKYDYAYVLKTDGALYGRDGAEWLMDGVAYVSSDAYGEDCDMALKSDGTLIALNKIAGDKSYKEWETTYAPGDVIATNVALPGQPFSSLRTKVAPFSDVFRDDYFADAVEWATHAQPPVTNGFPDGTFQPGSTVTRAQAVTFLWHAMGDPAPTQAESNPFADILEDAWYYQAALWAREQEITNGTGSTADGKIVYSPTDTLTRGQMITFLWRTLGEPDKTADREGKAWYEDAERWAVGREMLLSTAVPYATGGDCPRADVVYYLWKALN